MIYTILGQSNLYHNPDPLYRLLGEVNESTVLVEDQRARALIDSGSQLSSISLAWVKKLKLNPQQLHSVLQTEGSRGLDVPYLDYVETHLRVPEDKTFDTDVLLLILPDSAHTMHTPITLGTLHIHMAIKLATKMELENLYKQWNRSLIVTKSAMKETQLVNQEDTKIVSQLDSVVKIMKDTTMTPFETIKVKGVIRAPKHYKHIKVVIDELPEGQCCKDVAVVQQIQILRPGSNKIPVVLQNLSCRVLKIKKGMQIAHGEANNVVPPLTVPQLNDYVPKKVAENASKGDLLRNFPRENRGRLQKLFEILNLDGIESWDKQQQQSVRDLLSEYQHLFAMNLSELGKTSLVQHDIKLDMTV